MGKKRNLIYYIIALTFLILIFLTLSITLYLGTIRKEQYRERCEHLTLLTREVVDTVDLYIENLWNEMYTASHLLNAARKKGENDLAYAIGQTEYYLSINAGELYAVTAEHKLIAEKKIIPWNFSNIDLLDNEEIKEYSFIYSLNTGIADDMLIFLRRLDAPIDFNGNIVTHLVIARKMTILQDFFRSKAYQGKMTTIIMDNNGVCKYADLLLDTPFIGRDNLLDSLKNCGFKVAYDASIEEFIKAVKADINYTMLLKTDTGDFFICLDKLYYSDWNLLLVINANDVMVNHMYGSALFKRGLIIFFFLAFLAIFMIAFMFYVNNREYIMEKKNNERLKDLNDKATNANNAKTTFVSRLSHDIRTPINGIIGMSYIAKENIDDKSRVLDCLNKINNASDSLLVLLNDVLDMSKVESGKLILNYKDINLKSFLEQTALLASNNLVKRKLDFKTEFLIDKNTNVMMSELEVRQVLLNLLSNSIKYTLDGGHILFKAYLDEQEKYYNCYFIIQDTGIGMKEDFIKHLYDSFTREDTKLGSNIYGSGLGMNIVKTLIDKMKGQINVKSEVEKGSCFTVMLPLEKSGIKEKKEMSLELPDELKNINVLLAEDNSLNAEIAINILEKYHFNVILASNGEDAIKLFKESAVGFFDLILMDILMPIMDGYTATKVIRGLDRSDCNITIIAMSANAFTDDIKKSYESGMDGHISKPIEPKRLINKIIELKS